MDIEARTDTGPLLSFAASTDLNDDTGITVTLRLPEDQRILVEDVREAVAFLSLDGIPGDAHDRDWIRSVTVTMGKNTARAFSVDVMLGATNQNVPVLQGYF